MRPTAPSLVVSLAAVMLAAGGLQAQSRQVPVLLTADVPVTVSVDGTEVGTLAAGGTRQIMVGPGEHLIAAVAADGRRLTRVAKAQADQIVVSFEFDAAAAPAAAAPAAATPEAESAPARVPAGAKIHLAPMNGFETYLAAAIRKKDVPVMVVSSKDLADFQITGTAESKKPGLFRTIVTGQTGSEEGVSITVTHLRSGAVVYAYQYQKGDTFRGKQSSSESVAKHLKNHIEGKE
jgi:hypothetical protein